jgi:hypothetical protein
MLICYHIKVMNYEEFNIYERIEKPLTAFARGYKLPTGELFYIEPWFYTQFTRIEERYPERVKDMVNFMLEKVRKHKYVVFTRSYEHAIIKDEMYVAVEIDDLIAGCNIIIDDNSRGSDYGD